MPALRVAVFPPATGFLSQNWELIHATDRDGHTALHASACMGDLAMIRLLQSKGGNVNTKDYEGYTPLHWAVEHGQVAAARELVELGADPAAKVSGKKYMSHVLCSVKTLKKRSELQALLGISAASMNRARAELAYAASESGDATADAAGLSEE